MYSSDNITFSQMDKDNHLEIDGMYTDNNRAYIIRFTPYEDYNNGYRQGLLHIPGWADITINGGGNQVQFHGTTYTTSVSEGTEYYLLLVKKGSSDNTIYANVSTSLQDVTNVTLDDKGSVTYNKTQSSPIVIGSSSFDTNGEWTFFGSVNMSEFYIYEYSTGKLLYKAIYNNKDIASASRPGLIQIGETLKINNGIVDVNNETVNPIKLSLPVQSATVIKVGSRTIIDENSNTLQTVQTSSGNYSGGYYQLPNEFTIGSGNYLELRWVDKLPPENTSYVPGMLVGFYSSNSIDTDATACSIRYGGENYVLEAYTYATGSGTQQASLSDCYMMGMGTIYKQLVIDGTTVKLDGYYSDSYDPNESQSGGSPYEIDISSLDGYKINYIGFGSPFYDSSTQLPVIFDFSKSSIVTSSGGIANKVFNVGPTYETILNIDTDYLAIDAQGKLTLSAAVIAKLNQIT